MYAGSSRAGSEDPASEEPRPTSDSRTPGLQDPGPAFALRASARQALDPGLYLTAITDPPVRKYSVPSEIAGVAIA